MWTLLFCLSCSLVTYFRCVSMLSCQTISSMVVLLSGPLVGTPDFISSVILCCIYVAGLLRQAVFPTSWLGVSNVLPDLDLYMDYWFILSVMSMFVLCLFSGVDLPTSGGWGGGGGVFLMFVVFLRGGGGGTSVNLIA